MDGRIVSKVFRGAIGEGVGLGDSLLKKGAVVKS